LRVPLVTSSAKEKAIVEVTVLAVPEGNIIARGSQYGGPDYEFIIAVDGQVYFRVVGDADIVWAGRNSESFRRIAASWQKFQAEIGTLSSASAQKERVARQRQEFMQLEALPTDLPPDPEPLWSLLLFEAEHELG
jgi:hypothetical protein